MKSGKRLALIATLLFAWSLPPARAIDLFPGAEWQRMPTAEAGFSVATLATAYDRAAQLNMTAVMVIHHGVLVSEWGDTTKRTELASVRKSLLSALIGIAVGEKK